MNIVLCSKLKKHKHCAISLQGANILGKYITGAFFTGRPWYYPLAGKNKVWIDNRLNYKFDYNKIKSFASQYILYKFIVGNKIISHTIHTYKIDSFFKNLLGLYCYFNILTMKNITHFHYERSLGSKIAAKAKKRFNCKVIIDESLPNMKYLYNIMKEEYSKLDLNFDEDSFLGKYNAKDFETADYIIVPSNYCKYTFVSEGVKEEKLKVIPYGCDLSKFYPIAFKRDATFRVLFVGKICPRKGVHYLIDAIKAIKQKNIELLLVGMIEEGFEGVLKDLPACVKHIKYYPHSKLNEIYSKADVFVLPSLSDSFSVTTLEAMASGIPVIVSENVGAKEIVNNGDNGFVVPIRNCEAIIEKITVLYNNRFYAREMGKNARNSVIKFNWNEYGKKIISFYENI